MAMRNSIFFNMAYDFSNFVNRPELWRPIEDYKKDPKARRFCEFNSGQETTVAQV